MFIYTCLKVETGVNMQKKYAENGKISREKTVENNKIYAIALRFQVIEI